MSIQNSPYYRLGRLFGYAVQLKLSQALPGIIKNVQRELLFLPPLELFLQRHGLTFDQLSAPEGQVMREQFIDLAGRAVEKLRRDDPAAFANCEFQIPSPLLPIFDELIGESREGV